MHRDLDNMTAAALHAVVVRINAIILFKFSPVPPHLFSCWVESFICNSCIQPKCCKRVYYSPSIEWELKTLLTFKPQAQACANQSKHPGASMQRIWRKSLNGWKVICFHDALPQRIKVSKVSVPPKMLMYYLNGDLFIICIIHRI